MEVDEGAIAAAVVTARKAPRPEVVRRMLDCARVLDVIVRATCASLDPTSFCAACEALWPALDPAVLVRDHNRVYTSIENDVAPPHSSLRGMLIQLKAVASSNSRCATRLGDLYYDPEYATWIDKDVSDAAQMADNRRDFRSLMALRHRYGAAATHPITGIYPVNCDMFENVDLIAMVKTSMLDRRSLLVMLIESLEHRCDFFYKCLEFVRSKRDGPDHAPTTRMLEVMRRGAMELTCAAARSRNLRALHIIAESPVFGKPHGPCETLDNRDITRRSAMIVEISKIWQWQLRDKNAGDAVFVLVNDSVPSAELYLCAAVCAGEHCWIAAGALVTCMINRGGVRWVTDHDREFVRDTLYNAVTKHPPIDYQSVVNAVNLATRVLRMLKMDHVEPELRVCEALRSFAKEHR